MQSEDRPAYLDYQATTPLDPRVRDAMSPFWGEAFGNPHSKGHRYGWDAQEAVETGRSQVATLIGSGDDEIVFVSGATESCNLALRGIASGATDRSEIVTVATEHPAVLETARSLGSHGFDVKILPVGGDGLLDTSLVESALTDRTLLVSVMLANNEIGVIQSLEEISRLCRSVGAIIHTDATQAVGRMEVDVGELDVDLLSLSGHKIYGPNGVGALYVRASVKSCLEPVMSGGTQEGGLRPGTVAAPLAVGLGRACEIAGEEWRADARRLSELGDRLRSELVSAIPNLVVFGDVKQRIPGNLTVGLPGVLAEQVVAAVEDQIAISTGSACASGSARPSPVLEALGFDQEEASSGVRVSLGRFTTLEEVEIASFALRHAFGVTRRDKDG